MTGTNSTHPFSLLPDQAEKQLVGMLHFQTLEKGSLIFEQGITRVEDLWILSKGDACFFFETHQGRKLEGTLEQGDHFGSLSLIFNQGVAIRSLETVEKCKFARLPAQPFMEALEQYPRFAEYFDACFGKSMRNPAFQAMMADQQEGRDASLPFFNRPIRSAFTPSLISCSADTPVKEAAEKMSQNNTSAILVKKDKGAYEGIVTDADLRAKVVSKNLDINTPVSSIMSSPVARVSADSQVFEAFLNMVKDDLRHMAVSGSTGQTAGIIRQKDMISAQASSNFFLYKQIQTAKSMKHLEGFHTRMAQLLFDPIRNGANPEYVTRLITTFSDAVAGRIIQFTLDELGPPPCKFVFLIMGSQGRQEQTLVSDQDNAVLFEDTQDIKSATTYFNHFSELVCDRLDAAGFQFCTGGNMAKNEKWCQPLSQWKSYFDTWIRAANPERLLHSSIFFDFRGIWGETALADQLKSHLLASVGQWPGFLRNMTENAIFFKPPLTLFGRFILESKGPNKGRLDVKHAMLPIVDFIRIHALKNKIAETNTLTRMFRLYLRHTLTRKEHADLVRAYNVLMNIRFLNQMTAIMEEQREPDNHINPENISSLDQSLLKEIFKRAAGLQDRLSVEFTGVI